MENILLKVENLSKSYGAVKAVDNVSFEVRKGEFFAFLGPNGAGKSTTIKILTTLLKQDNGTYSLSGTSGDVAIRNKIGVVFQENNSDDFLTVKENLFFFGGLYVCDKAELQNKYEEVKELLDLGQFEKRVFRQLSGGQKRRVEIARALMSSPELLFLDEPTTGLDPESRKVIWSIVQNLQRQKSLTVFMTTHYMEETNDADYVVIINKGKIHAQGTPSHLKSTYANDILKIRPKKAAGLLDYLEKGGYEYKKVADTFVMKNLGVMDNISILEKNKENIGSFELIKGTMDDVFLAVVEGN